MSNKEYLVAQYYEVEKAGNIYIRNASCIVYAKNPAQAEEKFSECMLEEEKYFQFTKKHKIEVTELKSLPTLGKKPLKIYSLIERVLPWFFLSAICFYLWRKH